MIKLNQKLFDNDIEKLPIRKGYGEGLLIAGEVDERVVALCADLTESTQTHLFANRFPERFIQIGVAEQNLATVASGMAAMGKIPFITSYSMFSPGRNWEQVRTTICYNDRPVKIAGSHAGISVGPDGGSHQAVEDIAIMRVIPRMHVISPCDAIEARKATIAAAKTKNPTYIRLARNPTAVITLEDTPFEIGKGQVVFGEDSKAHVGIVATGTMVYRSIMAAKELKEEGIEAKVLNISTIKPLDEKAVIELAEETGCIVSAEEHQIAGGLGSAVAECLSQNFPVPQEFVGVKDKFGQSGEPDELVEHYGMGIGRIKELVLRVLDRKD